MATAADVARLVSGWYPMVDLVGLKEDLRLLEARFELHQVIEAIRVYRMEDTSGRPPPPGVLRAIIESRDREAAARIWGELRHDRELLLPPRAEAALTAIGGRAKLEGMAAWEAGDVGRLFIGAYMRERDVAVKQIPGRGFTTDPGGASLEPL